MSYPLQHIQQLLLLMMMILLLARVCIPSLQLTCRLIVRAELDAALHAHEASCLAEQLGVARAAAERAGSRWRAAEASKQILARCLASRTEQAAGHSAERLALQVRSQCMLCSPIRLCDQAAAAAAVANNFASSPPSLLSHTHECTTHLSAPCSLEPVAGTITIF